MCLPALSALCCRVLTVWCDSAQRNRAQSERRGHKQRNSSGAWRAPRESAKKCTLWVYLCQRSVRLTFSDLGTNLPFTLLSQRITAWVNKYATYKLKQRGRCSNSCIKANGAGRKCDMLYVTLWMWYVIYRLWINISLEFHSVTNFHIILSNRHSNKM